MAFANTKYLKSILRNPDRQKKIYWKGNRGFSLMSQNKVLFEDNAFVFPSPDLPDNYKQPNYESNNPYQKVSLDLIKKFAEGVVVDLGAGNPKHSFPNVIQIEIRKYPNTDIVIAGGKVPLKSNSVDAVISEAVLEHVTDPFLYVNEIFRILKPGGKVLLDAAFMCPLHGYPSHYFNTTSYAVKLLFEKFKINDLYVGPHQHPWITLWWIMHSYYNGIEDEAAKAQFKNMSVGEMMELLDKHQQDRSEIKQNPDPFYVANNLFEFNKTHQDSLGSFAAINSFCEEELAAGYEIYAEKPLT